MHAAPLLPTHPDYQEVSFLVDGLLTAAGGLERFASDVPELFRTAIDEVIDAPRTNRFTLAEIEQTEKTYLGTKVEILLRSYLKLPKGKEKLDLCINGVDCDIKNTMRDNWSIPKENVNLPAVLLRQNDTKARCDIGVGIMRDHYLRDVPNDDSKRGLKAAHFADIWWILKDHQYPVNFWEVLPTDTKKAILGAGKATARITKLFDLLRKTPISRTQIQAIGQELDYMNRIRRNGGARDHLAPRGIAILWGKGDRKLIAQLGLGSLYDDEFISYEATDPAEIALLKAAGKID